VFVQGPPSTRAASAGSRSEPAVLGLPAARRSTQLAWVLWGRPAGYAPITLGRRDDVVLPAVAAFAPDLVLADGLSAFATGWAVGKRAGVPVVYRSHNVEHEYARVCRRLLAELGQEEEAGSATSPWPRLLHPRHGAVRAYEERVLKRAALVLDISEDDAAFWRARGIDNLEVVPTFVATVADAADAADAEDGLGHGVDDATDAGGDGCDVLYLGNLYMPTNRHGLRWFLTNVVPMLRTSRPSVRVVVAGKRPTDDVRSACAAAGVDLRPDVADAGALLARAGVLVNPIFDGSGSNVKMVDMLASDRLIVTTPFGCRGSEWAVGDSVRVTDDAATFAAEIDRCLLLPVEAVTTATAARHRDLEQRHGHPAVERMVTLLDGVVRGDVHRPPDPVGGVGAQGHKRREPDPLAEEHGDKFLHRP
jgi:hypothetical protein